MIQLKVALVLLIGLLGFASVRAQAQQEECQGGVNYGNRGNNLISGQDFEGAILAYNCAIQFDPQNALWYLARGVAYLYTSRYDEALADITQADTLAPNTAPTQYYFGAVYAALGQHQSAIGYLDKAIDQQSDYLEAYAFRGVEYFSLKDYDTAILDFNRALEIQSKYAYALFYRAAAYANLRQYDNAIADLDLAIELEPVYTNTDFALGTSRVKASDYGRMVSLVRCLDLAIQHSPINANLYLYRGVAHSAINEYNEALADISQAIEANPDNAQAYYSRGVAYLLSQNDDAALADFDRATELNPNLFYVYLTRSMLYFKLKDYPHVIADYSYIIELYPDIPEKLYAGVMSFYDYLLLYRGYAYSLNGDDTEAAADFFRYASREGVQIVDAGILTVGQSSTIDMSTDKVFQFKFDATVGQILKLSAVSAYPYITVDTVMVILSPDGKPVDGNANSSEVDLAAILNDFEVPQDGTYTLLITHANGPHNGSVNVLIQVVPPPTP